MVIEKKFYHAAIFGTATNYINIHYKANPKKLLTCTHIGVHALWSFGDLRQKQLCPFLTSYCPRRH